MLHSLPAGSPCLGKHASIFKCRFISLPRASKVVGQFLMRWLPRLLGDVVRADRSRDLLRRALGLFGLLLVAATWRLWAPQQVYPQVPLVRGLDGLGPWFEWFAAAMMLVGLTGAMLAPRRLAPAALLTYAVATLLLVLVDQHRLQPWAYQFMIVAMVLALADATIGILFLRLFVVSFYFHSALTKLDYSFLHTLGQQFLGALAGIFGASLDSWSESARLAAAGALPGTELLIALGLCWRPTRLVALAAAVMLHVMLLVVLGPWGLDHKPGVLVWNVYFIVQDVLLFGLSTVTRWRHTCDNLSPIEVSSPRLSSGLICAVVLLPFLAPTAWFDIWPSWGLYAPSAERVQLLVHRREAEQLPGELQSFVEAMPGGEDTWLVVRLDRWSLESLSAPIYPQNRYQLGVAEAVIAKYGLLHRARVFRFDLADRFTGEREYTRFDGLAEVIGSAGEYYLNSRPRQNLLPAVGE